MNRLLKPTNQIVIACALTLAAVIVMHLQSRTQSGASPPAPRIEAKR